MFSFFSFEKNETPTSSYPLPPLPPLPPAPPLLPRLAGLPKIPSYSLLSSSFRFAPPELYTFCFKHSGQRRATQTTQAEGAF